MREFDTVKKDSFIEKINTYCIDNEIGLDLLKNEWDVFYNTIIDYLKILKKEDKNKKIISSIIDKAITDTIYFPADGFSNFNLYSLLSALWTLRGYGIDSSTINGIKQEIIDKTSWGEIIEIKKFIKKR